MMESSQSSPPLLRPLPRRPFQLASDSSNESSHPATPHVDQTQGTDEKGEMERTRSILNLTSSTLFGIYAPSAFDSTSQPQTPWGTGAETPMHKGSLDGFPSTRGGFRESELEERLLRDGLRTTGLDRRATTSPTSPTGRHVPRSTARKAFDTALRIVVLFGCGLAYGALIARLHDDRHVAPVRMDNPDRGGWKYLAFWGAASVALGLVLPWVDSVGIESDSQMPVKGATTSALQTSGLNAVEWNDVVRSVGAFVGVAYAIRKTPWSSPLQLSATLAMVNPFLWYLLDRTSAGFALSTTSGFLGVVGVLLLNPSWIPSPSHSLLAHTNATLSHSLQHSVPEVLESFLTHERVGSAIWIGSVFFCSCICFGNIGRLLASGQRQ